MFKPGDLVTIGDGYNVYTLIEDNNKEYVTAVINGISRNFKRIDGEHMSGLFPALKHYSAFEPQPSTPVGFAHEQVSGGTPKSKLTNPKDAIGSSKIPLHLWPSTATVLGSMALLEGALKYGRSNWRVAGVRATIYISALLRHTARLASGEWLDPDSGLPHVAHILACAAIIGDAKAAGKLNEDWEVKGGLVDLINEMTPHVDRLKELHKDKSPYHYTCADNEVASD